jgi:hypothetical protein
MDASNTCQLVTTVPFTTYTQIVTTASKLVEFTMGSGQVAAKFVTPAVTNDFTTFISTSNNFPAEYPVLPSGTTSIVKGYLMYPLGAYSNDFHVYGTFSNLSSVVSTMIASNDLCSSSNIYNTREYTGSNSIPGLSLTTLYQLLTRSDLPPEDAAAVHSNISKYETKNKIFYSFFVYEYCYYNTMYTQLLQQYFYEYTSNSPVSRLASITLLRNSAGSNCSVLATTDAQAARLDAIAITMAQVNSRLTDMRNLLSAIQDYYSTALQALQTTLNSSGQLGSDRDAETKVTALMTQSAVVQSAKNDANVRQGIMEYTSEKNRYSNVLLGIYAFLNIAIVAVIFTIKE